MEAPALVANLQSYVGSSGNLTPSLVTADGQSLGFKDAEQLASFALAQTVASGQDDAATCQTYRGTVAWLDQTGQGYVQAAANLQAKAQADAAAGNAAQALLENTGAQLADPGHGAQSAPQPHAACLAAQ